MEGSTNLTDEKLNKGYAQGSGSSLTKNVEFTCPSDGYIKAYYANSSSVKYASVLVKDTGGSFTGLFKMEMPASSIYQIITVFVKKGMVLKWENTSTNESVYFYPLV